VQEGARTQTAEQHEAAASAYKMTHLKRIKARQSLPDNWYLNLSDVDYDPATNFGNYPTFSVTDEEGLRLREAFINRKYYERVEQDTQGEVASNERDNSSVQPRQRGSSRRSSVGSSHQLISDENRESYRRSRFDSVKSNYKSLFKVSFPTCIRLTGRV
jgi:hypothetical protein